MTWNPIDQTFLIVNQNIKFNQVGQGIFFYLCFKHISKIYMPWNHTIIYLE